MLARFIRRVKALPRGRLMIVSSAVLVWLTISLPVWRLWNYDAGPGDPEHHWVSGSRQDGAGWVGFLVFWIVALELLRFVFNRPRRLERFHDRIIAGLALATAIFSVQVWWQGFYWVSLANDGLGMFAGPGWGVPFMIFATLAVVFSVVWSFRSTTAGGSIREWIATELRDAKAELIGPWWTGPTPEQPERPTAEPDLPAGMPPPPPPPAQT